MTEEGKESGKLEGTRKIRIVIAAACIALAAMVAAYYLVGSPGELFLAFSVVNVLFIVAMAVHVLANRRATLKGGYPLEDELTKTIKYKAGYYAWLATMYAVIGMMIVNIVMEETSSYHISVDRALPILAIFPGLTYILCTLRISAKGID